MEREDNDDNYIKRATTTDDGGLQKWLVVAFMGVEERERVQ